MDNLGFNCKDPKILHIDLNSCFATIEQQANPHLRGKPVAVCAYVTPRGCILAPSVEAKRFGVRTGMRVKDGINLCPKLIILPSDPWKYRNIHLRLRKIISDYTTDFIPKSIDEFVLNLEDYSGLLFKKISGKYSRQEVLSPMQRIAGDIKLRIKKEIGEWLTVSVGIAPNCFLAKLASGLKKPDGLEEINKDNFLKVYSNLKLTDLPYIKARNAIRLGDLRIYTLTDFFHAPLWKLKAAFKSINGYYWYLRLRGWEIDDFSTTRKSYGNSYALPYPLSTTDELSPILSKLVTKMSARLRFAGYQTRGIHLAVSYRNGFFWHKGVGLENALFETRDIYSKAYKILSSSPYRIPVRELSVSCFNLIKSNYSQLDFFEDVVKKKMLINSIDEINNRWGEFVVTMGRMLNAQKLIPDRISFGGIKELEEFTLN